MDWDIKIITFLNNYLFRWHAPTQSGQSPSKFLRKSRTEMTKSNFRQCNAVEKNNGFCMYLNKGTFT